MTQEKGHRCIFANFMCYHKVPVIHYVDIDFAAFDERFLRKILFFREFCSNGLMPRTKTLNNMLELFVRVLHKMREHQSFAEDLKRILTADHLVIILNKKIRESAYMECVAKLRQAMYELGFKGRIHLIDNSRLSRIINGTEEEKGLRDFIEVITGCSSATLEGKRRLSLLFGNVLKRLRPSCIKSNIVFFSRRYSATINGHRQPASIVLCKNVAGLKELVMVYKLEVLGYKAYADDFRRWILDISQKCKQSYEKIFLEFENKYGIPSLLVFEDVLQDFLIYLMTSCYQLWKFYFGKDKYRDAARKWLCGAFKKFTKGQFCNRIREYYKESSVVSGNWEQFAYSYGSNR